MQGIQTVLLLSCVCPEVTRCSAWGQSNRGKSEGYMVCRHASICQDQNVPHHWEQMRSWNLESQSQLQQGLWQQPQCLQLQTPPLWVPRKANTGPRSPVAPTGKEPTVEELSCKDSLPIALDFLPSFPRPDRTNKQHASHKICRCGWFIFLDSLLIKIPIGPRDKMVNKAG